MKPLLTGILAGIFASLIFTPIGGVVIGYLVWNKAKKDEQLEVS